MAGVICNHSYVITGVYTMYETHKGYSDSPILTCCNCEETLLFSMDGHSYSFVDLASALSFPSNFKGDKAVVWGQ